MSELDPSHSLEDRSLRTAAQLIERYNWRLLTAAQLAQLIRIQIEASSDTHIERCGMAAYCGALYAAASGGEGAPRQNQAYTELAKFLAGVLRLRHPSIPIDQRDDILQSALERVFRSFGACQEPTAFLAFAAYRLLDAVRLAQRKERRDPEPLPGKVGAEDNEYEIADTRQSAPDAKILADERIAGIERFLQLFLRAHPKAKQQVVILRLSLIADLTNDEIARQLGVSVGSIYTARSRFVEKLRSEPRWRALAGDLGILPDEL